MTNPLESVDREGPQVREALLVLVYDELRRLAARQQDGTQTLQPTALVHEAWIRLNSANCDLWHLICHSS